MSFDLFRAMKFMAWQCGEHGTYPLNLAEHRVLFAMLMKYNSQPNKNKPIAYAISLICEDCNIANKTAITAVKSLESMGLIYTMKDKGATSRYFLDAKIWNLEDATYVESSVENTQVDDTYVEITQVNTQVITPLVTQTITNNYSLQTLNTNTEIEKVSAEYTNRQKQKYAIEKHKESLTIGAIRGEPPTLEEFLKWSEQKGYNFTLFKRKKEDAHEFYNELVYWNWYHKIGKDTEPIDLLSIQTTWQEALAPIIKNKVNYFYKQKGQNS